MRPKSASSDSNVPSAVFVPPIYQIDPSKDGRLAILCDDNLWIFAPAAPPAGADPAPESFVPFDGTLLDLLSLCARSRIAAVWMVPLGDAIGRTDARLIRAWSGGGLSQSPKLRESFSIHELTARGGLGGSAQFAGIVARALDRRTGQQSGGVIRVIAPWVQDGWRLNGALARLSSVPSQRAAAVAGGLLRASFALGAQLRFSPSHTGLTMLRQELDRWQRRSVDLSLPEEWRARFHELRATPIQWARPAEERSSAMRGEPSSASLLTLWKYDRNGSYVASARDVPTGIPQPLGSPRTLTPGEKVLMGLYQVRATPPAWFDPAKLPGPFREHDAWTGSPVAAWTWEPQIRLALRHGWHIELLDGWWWPSAQVHDLFRSWQDRIFAARTATAGDRIANPIVKQVGVAAIGRLISTTGRAVMTAAEAEAKHLQPLWRFRDDAGKPTGMVEVELDVGRVDLIRPDWWSIVISNAVERLLEQAYTHGRDSTVLLYVDALYSLVPLPALAGSPTKRGGFKTEGIRPVAPELITGGDPIALVRAFARADEAVPDGS